MVKTSGRVAARYLAGAGVGTIGVDVSLVDAVRAVNRDIVVVPVDANDAIETGASAEERFADLDPAARELADGAMFALSELRRALLPGKAASS